ncbi:MAG TPA: hypothetical protein DCL77_17505 [Prolixibacteraceae bacterium]|nr:hypothetical protein [Prolixibacteraceae bacterium]
MNNKYFSKGCKSVLFLSLFICFIFTYCKPEPHEWIKKSDEQVAGDYIENNPYQYSEFNKLVVMTGLRSLLNIRGPFTIMLPTDSAMFSYYKLKNVNSLDDFTEAQRSDLVRYHIMSTEITSSDIGLGSLREPNAIGDYLASEFQGSDIYINKYSKIIHRDIRTANGYIHVINRVIDPVTKDVYTLLADDPNYSIFAEGLKLTGLKDTLQTISFPYGTKMARNRYTILAVADTTYQRKGINNVNDLIAWSGGTADNLTSKSNPFYRYIEYHCLNNSYYLSDFKSSIYPILSRDNNISVTIAEDYKINLNSKTKEYTGFNVTSSNLPAKNGVIHTIKDLLPVVDPEPAIFTFETTDYLEFKEGDFYGKYYYKWHDGQNSFAKIKFQGDYLLYYYKVNHGRSPILNYDNISMLGFWWIEITTPKVMKGHYAVSANIWSGGEDLPMFAAYVDGVKKADINARISGAKMDFGEVTYTKTEEHKIKLVCTGWGTLFWDSVTFTPIN